MDIGSIRSFFTSRWQQLTQRYTRRRCIMAAAAVFVLLAAVMLLLKAALFLRTSEGNGKAEAIIDFPSGTSLRKLAGELEAKRILSSPTLFVAYARFKGLDGRVQAGSYLFTDGMTPPEILGKLVAGDIYTKPFAVPEGYSTFQIATLLEQRGFCKGESFLKKCSSSEFLRRLGVEAASAEGYLFPGTYNLVGKKSEDEILHEMIAEFNRTQRPRFADRVKSSGMSWNEVLTLASMVEKEAIVPAERPVIASVFHNRLKKGMRLQSDPTAVYGVRAFSGKVTKADILRPSPYNTYTISRLPPGPIGNPSAAAIEAVLNPAKTTYLYFVARNDGSHHFSVTLDEHNRAVRQYLR